MAVVAKSSATPQYLIAFGDFIFAGDNP